MRSKKLLAMLLAVCMVMTYLAPMASAVEAPADSYVNAEAAKNANATKQKGASINNDRVVSGKDANGISTARDTLVPKVENQTANGDGDWKFTPTDKPGTNLLISDVPDCIEELRKAAEIYSPSEVVTAFVVMEDAPLAELYTSPSQVSAGEEEQLIKKQDAVITAIRKALPRSTDLEVRYQFTYLTNAFSIRTAFENLEKIAAVQGVKTVFLAPVYNPCTTDSPNTAASGAMTGVHTVWEDLGYTGAGMKIAVIDTGLDLDHPSFAADPETTVDSLTAAGVEAVLHDLNAYKYRSSVTADKLYRSVKVPYAFNYVDGNLTADHSSDMQGDHGTHVAGIAAANKLDTTTVVGMAPDAQLIIMKVFGAGGGAYTDDVVAALEDAMTLGCDAVNVSLGTPAGFSSTDTEIDLIYQRLASQDIIATISAGNEGTSGYDNMWGTDVNRTQNPDNGAVGSPSTYANAFSIASAENAEVMTNYFTLADGTKIFYMDSIEYLLGESYACMAGLDGETLEYVIVPNLGDKNDFYDAEGNSIVDGKVAVIKRGDLSFADKAWNATNAGAAAVVIWNNNDDDDIFSFGMTTESEMFGIPYIPVCLVTMSDGQKMADAADKTMYPTEEMAARPAEGGQMSSFSSWGTTPDLRLLPDITGIGGNVYSCYDGGQYGLMSGTSMSAPQLAGVSALVLQYLKDKYPSSTHGELREVALALMMSTADPIIDNTLGYFEASPRQQGAGLINAAQAVTSQAYLTVGGERPKAELGDSATGKFTFSFEIHNMGDTALTYKLDSSLLTEFVTAAGGECFMAGFEYPLSGDVTFNKDTVTVPANGIAYITATITLSDDDKAYFAQYWENGGYVEGYVYLYNEEGEAALNLPFMGFYGDWTDAPLFDSAYWYDNSFWGVAPVDGLPEGDEYYHAMWTSLAGTDWVLGFNPYSGAVTGADGKIIYDPSRNVVSPNGDGVLDGLTEIYLSLLRNAKTITMTYTVEGKVMHQEVFTNNNKTMYISGYGTVVPWLYSWNGNNLYDFTGADGKVLPTGTEVLLTIEAKLDYGTGGNSVMEIPIIVDNQMPEMVDVYEVEEEGRHYLVVEASDNHMLASVVLMNASGSRVYDQAYDVEMVETEDGTFLALLDVTDLGTKFTVAVCDYAANEAYYDVTYTSAGENLPDVPADQLFAYRVFDNYIYSDHMYGWVSMNKPASGDETANISVWTDDYLEYAAINAAEYAGGKIFAVDAVYNLFVMDPGLFDRQFVTNLGVNVLDMTFDDSTDTMYVLSKQGSYSYLYSMDLLTGELTQIKSFGYYSRAPWAIADDDNGTLYAIKYASSNIFTVDVAGGTYNMTAVNDAEGNPVVITDSNGENVSPSAHSQSITWANGTLYWAYFKESYYSPAADLITINTTDWTHYASVYAATGYDGEQEVEYSPVTELVGLLVLDETDYQIPASTEASSVALDAEQVILGIGDSQTLSASWLPWNYNLDKSRLVWTSSDETVATVEGGLVTAVAEGVAEITVAYGDLEATCEVIVVDITGTFDAYNYYTGDDHYGTMITVDMETMDYSLVSDASPVDFMAGDYNGHDGYFYGYDMGGQLYRYDYETNEAAPLGASLGTYPVDMAYDYSTGMMYALVLDYTSYENTLYAVNMNNGNTLELAVGMGLMTLACSTDGTLYSMDASGNLCQVEIMDYSEYGGPVMLEPVAYILDESFGDLYLLQSMCWDHNNNVLLWNWCEAATVLWIDVEQGIYVNLGDPSESGVLELTGMHVIPETIVPLPEVAVESVTAEDMLILTGYEKVPSVTVAPFNATCQNVVMVSSDTSVVEITAAGTLKGVSAGTAEITATLEDTVGTKDYEVTFTVTVMDGADNLYGHLLTDFATYNGQQWIQLYAGDPGNYELGAYFDYTIYTEEYFDGKIYTYGYDAYDWEANWQFFVLNAETYEVEQQIDMGEAFPYVYDMTYDYNTAAMYVLAGSSEDNTDLYVADMETGKLVLLMEVDELLMAIAAGPDGKLYAVENSQMIYDEWDPWAVPVATNAMLYVIDPIAGTMELVGDTGLKSNMISSMTYDYDTDALYWTPMYAETHQGPYESSLAMVDVETGAAMSLGAIGSAGAQVGGLYVICDEFPETNSDTLHNLLMAEGKKTLFVGDEAALSVIMMPAGLDAELTWTSSNPAVATVDAEGNVTGVSQGSTKITATATFNGVTKTASCNVAVLDTDAAFLTWNSTDMGWSAISRSDYTVVTNLTEGENTGVITVASVGLEVYGYDEYSQLFKLNTETYERTPIGEGLGYEVDEDCQFIIKDMEYDAANDRMLVLADTLMWDDYYGEYGEIYGGCALYTVDLTTGELNELYVFQDYSFVYAMTVGKNGQVYFYNTYDDGVDALDPDTGVVSRIVTLQSQSFYGDMYCDYAMHYDAMTDVIYLLFTGNGNFYRMLTVDATLGTLINEGYVGYIDMEDIYLGDLFRGLTFVCEEAEAYSVEWVSVSTSLGGNIGLNFFAKLSENLVNDPDAFVRFTVDGKNVDVPMSEAVVSVKEGVTRYRFTCPVASKCMAETVTAQVMNAEGAVGASTGMSVAAYCTFMAQNSADADLVALMKAMLNYGANAQVLFGHHTDSLANAGLDAADKVLADVDASEFACTITGSEEGIQLTSATLLLDSETSVRLYFTVTGDVADYTFTVDGEEVTPGEKDGKYYLELKNVPAHKLSELYTFTLGDITVEFGAFSYVDMVLNNTAASEALVNTAKALYAYGVAAEAYAN